MKSHIVFTKSERYGIFVLVIIIIMLQVLYWFWPKSPDVEISIEQNQALQQHQKHIDSLKLLAIETNKPKQYPFNPNFITDYKGYTLGMSNEEIDRLLAYRKQGKWVNSVKDFQNVTKVSDSLLDSFSHLFKFPDFITNPKQRASFKEPKKLSFKEKKDLNTATAEDLQKVYGIGPYYSSKIVAYRDKLSGFSNSLQLQDIYGLKPDVVENILKTFAVKTPKNIEKVNLNTAKVTDLSELPNLNYEIARQIIKFRETNGNFTDINQLKSIAVFPSEKLDRIRLYLAIE